MKTLFTSIVWTSLIVVGFYGCQKDEHQKLSGYLDSIKSNKYYSEEIIPLEHQTIYGKWQLLRVTGGWGGVELEKKYEYLELKSKGIYSLIRNDSIVEYGKLELAPNNTSRSLALYLRPDYADKRSSYLIIPKFYFNIQGTDTLNMISECCDLNDYQYKRVK